MTRFTEPDERQVGTLRNGLPTCAFLAKPYPRIITNLTVENSVPSAVACYRGAIGVNLVANNSVGIVNTLRGEIRIPAGQAFYVQWSAVGSNVRNAQATVSWQRTSDPDDTTDSVAARLIWNENTEQTEFGGLVILKQLVVTIAGPTSYGPFFMGNMPYVQVELSPVNAATTVEVIIQWFPDDTLSVVSGTDTYVVNTTGTTSTQCFPVKGAYARFDVRRSAYPGAIFLIVNTVAVPTAFTGSSNLQAGSNVLLSVDNQIIGAGATITSLASATRGGWIHWMCEPFNSPTFISRLYATDFGGARVMLDASLIPGAGRSGLVFAPALPLSIDATNTDGVLHTYFASIVHHPFLF